MSRSSPSASRACLAFSWYASRRLASASQNPVSAMTMLAPKALVQTRFIGRREVGLGLTATDETRQVDRFSCGAARPTDFGEVALKRNAHDVRRALPGRPLQGFELPSQLLGQSRIESHQAPLSYALYDRRKAMSRRGGAAFGRLGGSGGSERRPLVPVPIS